jgi:hypothetical protein
MLNCITEAIQVTDGRMFASPAICHFWKTRNQCLSGMTENHGTLVGRVGFRAGMKHKTFRICCTLHHIMCTCQPHNHLRNKTPYDCRRPVRKLRIPPTPRLTPTVQLHPSIPHLRRQSTVSRSGQHDYYDVAWGVSKVHLK